MVTLFGFEIEGIFNKTVLHKNNLNAQGYHHGRFGTVDSLPSWKIETDSSLDSKGEFRFCEGYEFISRLLAEEDILEALDEIRDSTNNLPLNKVVKFNDSCGCHIHFSDTKGDSESFTTYTYLRKMRDKVFERIKKELPQIYDSFKGQYYRDYAREITSESINTSERRLEFNYSSPNKGAEWRGFNLQGVKTWEELRRMFKIATEEIQNMLEDYRRNNKQEELLIEITPEFIKDNKVVIRVDNNV